MPPIPSLQKRKEKKSRKTKEGLRKPQVHILKILLPGGFLSRSKIADRSLIAINTLCPMLGTGDPDASERIEKRCGVKSLVTLGYVNVITIDVDGLAEDVYSITAAGREAFEQIADSLE